MWPNDFRKQFATYAHCAPEQFTSKVFWRVLYFHAIPVACLIRLVVPDFFRLDLETIERVGQTENGREFTRDLDRFRYLNGEKHSLLRSLLFIRISGKKLVRLRRKVDRAFARRQELGAGQLGTAR
jgi:hypothetical protein